MTDPGASVTPTEPRLDSVADRHREALVRLTDALKSLDDPAEAAFAASKIMGEMLQASRVGYGTVDPEADVLYVERDWTRAVWSLLPELRRYVLTDRSLTA